MLRQPLSAAARPSTRGLVVESVGSGAAGDFLRAAEQLEAGIEGGLWLANTRACARLASGAYLLVSDVAQAISELAEARRQ